MTEGTKSILIGFHSIIHSILLIIAWRIVYGKWPGLKIMICCMIHDIGYYGMNYITNKSNAGHAELGAIIAGKLFGKEYHDLVLGHSSSSIKKHLVYDIRMDGPDEYTALIAPVWGLDMVNVIEGYKVDGKTWKKAIRKNYYSDNKISGTKLYHSLRNKV